MFRSKLRLFSAIAASTPVFVIAAACALFIYGYPEHPVNVALFKIAYRITPVKKSFLEFYSPHRRDVANGTIPAEVDEFLCRRAETADEDETSALVNFYALQAGGREGNCIFKVSDEARQKIAARIVDEFDDTRHLAKKMILLEEIRLGESLGKGHIFIKNFAPPQNLKADQWGDWYDENVAARARPDFLTWWNSSADWETKKNIDPLENSEIKISKCCG